MAIEIQNSLRQRAAYDLHHEGYVASVGRIHRMFERYTIKRWAPLVRNLDVLDLGCGRGYVAEALRNSGFRSYVGIDISKKMIEVNTANWRASSNVHFRVDDAETLMTCPDASFDIVISYGCLHHLEHPETALFASARVLRSPGRLVGIELNRETPSTGFLGFWSTITSVPFVKLRPLAERLKKRLLRLRPSNAAGLYLDAHPGHPGRRTPQEYRSFMQGAGFRSCNVEGLFADMLPGALCRRSQVLLSLTVALSRHVLRRSPLMENASVLLLEGRM